MKKISALALCVAVFMTIKSSYGAIPPPPPQETLNKLKELGDQNLQKYGDGGVTFVNGEYVIAPKNIPTPIPTATPTPSPTLLPTNTPIPTPTKRMEQKVADTVSGGVSSFRESITLFFQKYFVSLFLKPQSNNKGFVKIAVVKPTLTPILINNDKAEALWQKGFDIWVNTKDYEKSSSYYKQALEINPNYVPALASYGYMLGAFYNRYNEGEAMLIKAKNLDPTWAYAPYNLGLLYDISGKKKEGIYWLQYTVDHFPNHPDIEWFTEHLKSAINN